MQARDVMTRGIVSVTPQTDVPAMAALMVEKRVSAVPVVEHGGKLLGIVSEGDLIRQIGHGEGERGSWWLDILSSPDAKAEAYLRTHGRVAKDVMTTDVVTVAPDTPVEAIARLLEEKRIKRVPVVENGAIVGIVSRADLLRALAVERPATTSATDDRAIRERLEAELQAAGLAYNPYVNIIVSNGVVHLWGLADTKKQAEALALAARNIPGVREVDSHLVTRPAPIDV